MSTYTLLSDGKAIHCSRCGRISHNPKDVAERYCGHCHVFHDEVLWGVFDVRVGLLCADTEAKCRSLVADWKRAGVDDGRYAVRPLNEEEARRARSWAELPR